MNPDQILKQAADNCDEKETACKQFYKHALNGNHTEAANVLMSHIMGRPVHQNPQTYDDLQKPIMGE